VVPAPTAPVVFILLNFGFEWFGRDGDGDEGDVEVRVARVQWLVVGYVAISGDVIFWCS